MKLAAAVAGWILALAAPVQASGLRDFSVETSHSLVEFNIGFLHTSVRGRFDGYRGTILYDQDRPESSSITVVIETKSLDTGSDHRDEHLRSDDFFDVEKYPAIRFQSREVRRQGGDLLLVGPLSMHGVTREVQIPFRVVQQPTSDGHGLTTLNFEGGLRLARKDQGDLDRVRHGGAADRIEPVVVLAASQPSCFRARPRRTPAWRGRWRAHACAGVQAEAVAGSEVVPQPTAERRIIRRTTAV
ncbi:MAG TPA: YceI family protein [Candidatus Eisenbacteria bacterium]|nr:YceI family protein [Candidatus Eisenbacteria bacterium]